MRDAEIVASIVAGNPAGLAEAYDRYADALYTYCRFMLHDPADAGEAVRDAFVLAAERMERLRDPGHLRPWLYAMARSECLWRLRARRSDSAAGQPDDDADHVDDADDADDGSNTAVDIPVYSEQDDLLLALREADSGLAPGEREAIELAFGHRLSVTDVALVLGISRDVAGSLLSRSCDELWACLGDLLVARNGRAECAALDSTLGGWDEGFTPLMRSRVQRHAQWCVACSGLRIAELDRVARVLDVPSPQALAELLVNDTRLAGIAPPALRDQVLWAASSHDDDDLLTRGLLDRDPLAQDLLWQQSDVRSRAGSFTRNGFPKAPPMPGMGRHRAPNRRVATTAGVLAVAAALVVGVTLTIHATAGSGGNTPENFLLAPTQPPQLAPPASTGAAVAGAPTAGAAPVGTLPAAATPSATPSATATPTATPSATVPGTPTATPAGAPSVTITPVLPLSPSPSSSLLPPSATAAPTTTTPAPPPTTTQPPGTLSISTSEVTLSPFQTSAQITLTAEGGPVSWSVTLVSGSGALSVSPADGTLAAGQSVTVTVSVPPGTRSFNKAVLEFDPGAQTVTVDFNRRS